MRDEASDWSALSNGVKVTTKAYDHVPPAMIKDLETSPERSAGRENLSPAPSASGGSSHSGAHVGAMLIRGQEFANKAKVVLQADQVIDTKDDRAGDQRHGGALGSLSDPDRSGEHEKDAVCLSQAVQHCQHGMACVPVRETGNQRAPVDLALVLEYQAALRAIINMRLQRAEAFRAGGVHFTRPRSLGSAFLYQSGRQDLESPLIVA